MEDGLELFARTFTDVPKQASSMSFWGPPGGERPFITWGWW